jgi:hypothetical protein
MTLTRFFIAAVVLGSASGCTYSSTTSTVPPSAHRPIVEQACADYGFRAGTDSYSRCASGESAARTLDRVPVTYNSMNLTIDAQNACYSYGLASGSETYDRCVNREIEARRYREAAVVPASSAPYPAPGTAR